MSAACRPCFVECEAGAVFFCVLMMLWLCRLCVPFLKLRSRDVPFSSAALHRIQVHVFCEDL